MSQDTDLALYYTRAQVDTKLAGIVGATGAGATGATGPTGPAGPTGSSILVDFDGGSATSVGASFPLQLDLGSA